MRLTGDDDYLIGACFDAIIKEEQGKATPVLRKTLDWLDAYFAGKNPGPIPKVKLSGTDFRLMVWEYLKQIPYGETTTYGEIAKLIAKERGIERMSAQAVGGAVGHNPIAILIPCHRVIGSGGQLTGYAGGIQRKEYLLRLERII